MNYLISSILFTIGAAVPVITSIYDLDWSRSAIEYCIAYVLYFFGYLWYTIVFYSDSVSVYETGTNGYVWSSSLFTISSIILFHVSLYDYMSFDDIGTCITNLLYVAGYMWYTYECWVDTKSHLLPLYLNRLQ